ncbi:MAG TPA: 2Fe-2S iron-sulfur cluster-binding protein [Kofleriaceae bacterium]|nr:2Fe-2S iron-sulfur cluster-binding protein [Kofleriaceae bacterium]
MAGNRLPEFDRGKAVSLRCEGEPVRAFAGENIAVALYARGAGVLSRSLKYHRPRSFFCLEGHCGACLMRIGGVPNLRACMEPCAEGLSVEGQNAYPSPDMDVLGAVDWLFPDGMNHHTLMTGSRLLNQVVSKVVRQLSGLGTLPGSPEPATACESPAWDELEVDVLVVGGGPAGLAAAEASAAAGARTVVCDEHDRPGGSLLADPRHGPRDAAGRADAARRAGARALLRTTFIGHYPEDGGVLLLAGPDRLTRVRARQVVYATGGYAQTLLFANNDRPGVMAARAVGRLLVRYGVAPAGRVCLVIGRDADRDQTDALAAALVAAGSEVVTVDERREQILAARGRVWVSALEVAGADGQVRRVPCNMVAVAAPPSPASEGPRQHGCEVDLRPSEGGFAVVADRDGRTSVAGILACGDVCGATTAERAAAAGTRAGRAAAAGAGAR